MLPDHRRMSVNVTALKDDSSYAGISGWEIVPLNANDLSGTIPYPLVDGDGEYVPEAITFHFHPGVLRNEAVCCIQLWANGQPVFVSSEVGGNLQASRRDDPPGQPAAVAIRIKENDDALTWVTFRVPYPVSVTYRIWLERAPDEKDWELLPTMPFRITAS